MPQTPLRIALVTVAATAAAVLAVVAVAACGGSSPGSPHASTSGETPPAPVMTPSHNTLPPSNPSTPLATSASPETAAVQSVSLDSTAWLAGFKVRVTQAEVDPTTDSVNVEVTLTNTAQIDQRLSADADELSLDPGDDSGLLTVEQVKPSGVVVAGTSARSILVFRASAPISLAKAVLVLGKAAHHQWRVPLQAGVAATGEAPVSLASPGRLATAHAYLKITAAEVLPWSCTGITPYTSYVPGDKSTSVVAIHGSAGAVVVPAGGTAIESMSLAAPDGTTAAVITLPLKVWFAGQSTPDIRLCLPVPAGLSGSYVLTITDSQRTSATAKITIP